MTALKSTPALKATGIEARCAATGMRMTEQRRVIARVLADALVQSLTAVADWDKGEWDKDALALWKQLGVDLVAEEAKHAPKPELPLKVEEKQLEINGTKATKGTHARKAMVAKIKAAQKARWNKIKADKAKG